MMPKPTLAQRRQEATRREIALVATRLFSENGVHGTTVAQIVAESGVAQRTFYTYFDSKQSAIMPLLNDGSRLLLKALADIDLDVPLEDALPRAIAATFSVSEVSQHTRETEWARDLMKCIELDPPLAAVWAMSLRTAEIELCEALAARPDAPKDEISLKLMSASIVTSTRIAMEVWAAAAPGTVDAGAIAIACANTLLARQTSAGSAPALAPHGLPAGSSL